jgi:hypothetical protein
VPQREAFAWPSGAGDGNVFRLALPVVHKYSNISPLPLGVELTLVNLNTSAGPATVEIRLFDQGGHVGTIAAQMAGGRMVFEELNQWATLPAGFQGSAIVLVDVPASPVPIGIAGVLAARLSPARTTDVLGDEWAAMSAIPLRGPDTYGGLPYALRLPLVRGP